MVAVAMTASAIAVIVRTRTFYFFSDDFLNFIIAEDMGLSWKYLFRDVFGQFVPLYRLADTLYWHLFGLRFWPFRALLIMFGWLAIWLLARLAWRRGVGMIQTLPILALLICSPVFVTTYQWWSAALSVLSSASASLACITLVAQEEVPGLPRKLTVAACFLAGLLCYPKGLFTVVLLLTVRLFCRVSNGQTKLWPVLLGSMRDVWPTLVLVPVYLGIVHLGHYSSNVVRPDPATLARFVWVGWNGGFLTATLGLQHGTGGLAAANLLVLALVLWSASRNPVSLILWGGFVLYFVASIGVIGWNRAVPFGIEAAEAGRYYADILCLFLAFVLIALGRSAGNLRVSHWQSLVVVAATAFGSMHMLAAGAAVPHLWYAGPERPAAFVTNLRAVLSANGEDMIIADDALPGYIMPGWMAPLNRYRLFLRLLGWRGRAGSARSFDQDGHLR